MSRNAIQETTLAISLTMLIGALLATALWWDARQTAPAPTPSPTATHSATEAASPPSARPHTPPATTEQNQALVRCEHQGRVTYQRGACAPEARQAQVAGGTFSVVSPPSAPSPSPQARPPETRIEHSQVGFIARTSSLGELHARHCALLEERIARIDESARRGQSSRSQEQLKEDRRRVQEEMWELKCGF